MSALIATDLGKAYRRYHKPIDSLKELVFRRQYHEKFWALKGASFRCEKGEVLGVVGDNGSSGADTFVWQAGDQGVSGDPAEDTVTDFFLGTDSLDLADLLGGEDNLSALLGDADALDDYVTIELVGSDTVISIDSDGAGGGSLDVDQTITLTDVDAVGSSTDQVQILQNLLNNADPTI